MNVAFFLDISHGLGGAGNLLIQQAVLMSELYNTIVVIPTDKAGNYSNEYVERCKRYGIPYRFIQYSTAYAFSQIDFTAAMRSVSDIEKFTKREEINFFHSVQLNIAVEFVSREFGIPHLMDIYQLGEDDFKICPGDIYPHYHLCDSFLYAGRWRYQLGIESRCIRPVAPLSEIRKKRTYTPEKIKILMLGSLCMRKNQMEAIKAIEQCTEFFKVELHIAGDLDNNYGVECKKYVRNHKLEKIVFFYGFISKIEPLLESSDCLLCSSIDESFPSSIVEALTYDLTIISTPVAGVPELMIDKENSFISKGFSNNFIAESILECVEFYRNGNIVNIHKNAGKTWLENFDRKTIKNCISLYYNYMKSRNVSSNLEPFFKTKKTVEIVDRLIKGIDVMGEEWVYGRSLYYTVMKEHVRNGKIYIWGAGKRGRITLEILKKICPDAEIVAFVDTYKDGYYCDIPIIKIDDISIDKNNNYCVSFAVDNDKAVQYLEKRDLELNEHIWIMP